MKTRRIKIRGARQHNLKNVSLNIPRDQLIVITGVSGSGKSSLAFDTIYAEGQRRYVESLSSYARQFLEQMEKPDVDSIEGLSPAISIEHRSSSQNPRSTVGTVTEIYDYLRVLYARVGRRYCPDCGIPVSSQTTQEIVDQITALGEGRRIQILAPVAVSKRGAHTQLLRRLERDGFTRVRVDGQIRLLEEDIVLERGKRHQIEVLVDRLVIGKKIRQRLTDSLELALGLSDGSAVVDVVGEEERYYSRKAVCPRCARSFPDLTPPMFSFNNPQGACESCKGIGTRRYFDPDLIVPDRSLSLREGAIAPWRNRHSMYFQQVMESLCKHYGSDICTPFSDLPERLQQVLLYGSGDEEINFYFEKDDRRYGYSRPFEGVIPKLQRSYSEARHVQAREEIEDFMAVRSCPVCNGARLKPLSRAVRIGGRGIHEVCALPVSGALKFFESLSLEAREEAIAQKLLKEILARLRFLESVGLHYLTIDRRTSTLSGGEEQRIRLATQIGSGLAGVLYVLDEPSIGLHQRDNGRLLHNLMRLRDLGNTVIVVEHDAQTIMSCDYVVDVGPGAGLKGGDIVFDGRPEDLVKDRNSLTGQYLSGRRTIRIPSSRRSGHGRGLEIEGAWENNLKGVNVRIPLGTLCCITGVSGSGKSSLINDILHPAISQRLYGSRKRVGAFSGIRGVEHIDKVVNIDQSPIGRTPRSNPATYTGVFAHIRELFSMLPESRMRGYRPGRFSFNTKGGRCEACKGEGVIKIEMHFLPDTYVTCERCNGLRYNRETLEIKYKGYTIADVLAMTVNEAAELFGHIPNIRHKLTTLIDVGLGYIKLGQQATTLSAGEAQRVKLSRELSKRTTGRTLYLLDEPTTGLHFADIEKLLEVLDYLVELGNTVVVIEHNLDVIKSADHVIDLGPEGGEQGGCVVGTGTPEVISGMAESYTGQYLRRALAYERPEIEPHGPGPGEETSKLRHLKDAKAFSSSE